MRSSSRVVAAVVLAVLAASGCWHGSLYASRPKDRLVDDAINKLWADEIRRVARDGDWILSRSYSAVGDAIVLATSGEELSHAAILDPEHDAVIEAVTEGVRAVPIGDFMRRNRYAMVVRPSRMNAVDRRGALGRARSVIGAGFDYRGMLGLDDTSAFYCSELVYWASRIAAWDPDPPTVVTPAELLRYGQVVYFSGRRDDPQLSRDVGGWLEGQAAEAERVAAAARGDDGGPVRVDLEPSATAVAGAAGSGPAPSARRPPESDTALTSIDTFAVERLAIQRDRGR